MQQTLSGKLPVVNSSVCSSIFQIQNDEIERQHFAVLRQEALRQDRIDSMPFFYAAPVPEVVQPGLDFQAPRPCNTGALNPTELDAEQSLKIDWLEFTVKSLGPESLVPEYLGLSWSVFTVQDFGLQGYPESAVYGKIIVLWSDRAPERGTKIILSSQALDQVKTDAIDIIRLIQRDGGTFARIDIAMDDRSGAVDIDTVIDSVRAQEDVNRFTQIEFREPIDRRTRQPVGRSVYWGKPSSSRQVTFYDKQIERLAKTGEDLGPWLRCEVRWKKRAANLAAFQLANFGLSCAVRLIAGVIDFREKDDERTARRTVCSWWASWIGTVEPIRTGVGKVVKTIEEKASWLGRQVAKTMGQVAAILDADTIVEMIKAGIHATTEKEWKLLDPTGRRVIWSADGQFKGIIPF